MELIGCYGCIRNIHCAYYYFSYALSAVPVGQTRNLKLHLKKGLIEIESRMSLK